MACLDCSNCPDLGVYDICAESIDLALAPAALTEYTVVIKDLSTNAKFIYTETSASNKMLSLFPQQVGNRTKKFAPNRTYEISAYIPNQGLNNPVNLTNPANEDEVSTCFSFTLENFDDLTEL